MIVAELERANNRVASAERRNVCIKASKLRLTTEYALPCFRNYFERKLSLSEVGVIPRAGEGFCCPSSELHLTKPQDRSSREADRRNHVRIGTIIPPPGDTKSRKLRNRSRATKEYRREGEGFVCSGMFASSPTLWAFFS